MESNLKNGSLWANIPPRWQANFFMLITALIWGIAFVAQRVGMQHFGPFSFTGIRFTLGSLLILPIILRADRLMPSQRTAWRNPVLHKGGVLAGLFLFGGVTLQQLALKYPETTAGKAGFITGFYVVLVPILGLFLGQRISWQTWVGGFGAVIGLYLLTMTEQLTIGFSDSLVLVSAFIWAGHVQIIGRYAPRTDGIKLAFIQFITCALLSNVIALFTETLSLDDLRAGMIPLLYASIFSVGVAYTLQVVAQRHAHPAHAAIILSLESAFSALGGWLILGELLSQRALIGCVLMFISMIISQLNQSTPTKKEGENDVGNSHWA